MKCEEESADEQKNQNAALQGVPNGREENSEQFMGL